MDSTRLKTEAPKLEWRDSGLLFTAQFNGYDFGDTWFDDDTMEWDAVFMRRAMPESCGTSSEAKQWVETQWQEFWAKIHEVEG